MVPPNSWVSLDTLARLILIIGFSVEWLDPSIWYFVDVVVQKRFSSSISRVQRLVSCLQWRISSPITLWMDLFLLAVEICQKTNNIGHERGGSMDVWGICGHVETFPVGYLPFVK